MTNHDSDLFYHFYGTINEHYQIWENHFLYIILFWNYMKSSSVTLNVLSLIIIFMLSIFECITRSSSLPLK